MELGSEYNLALSDLTIKDNNIFKYLSCYRHKCFFDSGRSALKHLSSFFSIIDEILLPEFICESVSNCFNKEKIRYYKINRDFSVDMESIESQINEHTRAVFLMHYFGELQPKELMLRIVGIAKKWNLLLIEDTTHSIFSKLETIGDYQICSIRKWLPIPSGGILYSKKDPLGVYKDIQYTASLDNDRSYGMILKDLFLKTGYDCNDEYRKIFRQCEDRLDYQNEIFLLSDFSHFIASCTDLEKMIIARIENYYYLYSSLMEYDIKPAINLHNGNCPFVFPIKVRERDKFRAFLMDNKIYCAVHWPFDGEMEDDRLFAAECARTLISLPIDQRYDIDAIDFLVETIRRYRNKQLC